MLSGRVFRGEFKKPKQSLSKFISNHDRPKRPMKLDLNVPLLTYGEFSYDVTSAILVCQNNETAAMLVSHPPVQTSSVEVEPVSFVLRKLS